MYVHHAISEVSQIILESKDKYYNKLTFKFNNPKTSSKTYCSILKTFYNGRKTPIIPPLVKDGIKLNLILKLRLIISIIFLLMSVKHMGMMVFW